MGSSASKQNNAGSEAPSDALGAEHSHAPRAEPTVAHLDIASAQWTSERASFKVVGLCDASKVHYTDGTINSITARELVAEIILDERPGTVGLQSSRRRLRHRFPDRRTYFSVLPEDFVRDEVEPSAANLPVLADTVLFGQWQRGMAMLSRDPVQTGMPSGGIALETPRLRRVREDIKKSNQLEEEVLPPELLAQDLQDSLKVAYTTTVEPPVSGRVLPLERHEAVGRIRTRTFVNLVDTVLGAKEILGGWKQVLRAAAAVATADRSQVATIIRQVGAVATDRTRRAQEELKAHASSAGKGVSGKDEDTAEDQSLSRTDAGAGHPTIPKPVSLRIGTDSMRSLAARDSANDVGAFFQRAADAIEKPAIVDDAWLGKTRSLGPSLEHARSAMRASGGSKCPWETAAQLADAREREEIVAFRLQAQGTGKVLALVDEHLLPGVCARFGRVPVARAKELVRPPSNSLLSDVAIPVTSAVLFSGGAYLARKRAPALFLGMVAVPALVAAGTMALYSGSRRLLAPVESSIMRADRTRQAGMVEQARLELLRRGGTDRLRVAGTLERGVTLPFASGSAVEEKRG